MEQDIQEIKHKLSTCDHQVRLLPQYNIATWRLGKTAIRFWLDCFDGYICSPMSRKYGNRIWKEDILKAKSITCESGIYAIPFDSYDSDGYYEKLIMAFHYFSFFVLLEYEESDVIYVNNNKFKHEICLHRSNIVFAGNYIDYARNSEEALRKFAIEKQRLYLLRTLEMNIK